jgi:ADP-ribose pyrophosphatase YjhB (NUDIX family)
MINSDACGKIKAKNHPKVAVLAVTFRGDEVILVQRKKEPQKGSWGFPGGSVELDESLADAAIRELFEETGVKAEVTVPFDIIELRQTDPQGQFHHFILIAMLCRYIAGNLVPGDDATDCRWVSVPCGLKHFDSILADHAVRVAYKASELWLKKVESDCRVT